MEIYKRSWNSNHYGLENGQKEAIIYPGWKNWMDVGEVWKPIDIDLVDNGEYYSVEKAPFSVKIPKISTEPAVFISDNLYSPVLKQKINSLPLEMTITAVGVNEVPGKLEMGDLGFGEMEYVVYEGAYSNADLIYYVDPSPALRKIIRFNKNPNAPSDLEYKFDIAFDKPTEIYEGEELKGEVCTAGEFEVYAKNDDYRMIRFLCAHVWHEWNTKLEVKNEKLKVVNTRQSIEVAFDGNILTKIIPKSFLDSAKYPVYADATVSFDPSPGSADGYTTWSTTAQNWGVARSSVGISFNNTDIYMIAYLQAGSDPNKWDTFYRAIATYDTSSLDDGTSLNFATLNLNILGSDLLDQKLVVVSATTATNNAVNVTDHLSTGFGSTHFTPDIPLISDSYLLYLNNAGVAHINKTGFTKFGFLISGDADNLEPTWVSGRYSYAYISTSEGSGIPLKVNYGSTIGQILPMRGIG